MTASPLIVSLQSVTYSYGRDQAAISVLTGADLEVREGEFVVVAGPSGSGKSTLLNLVGGLERPLAGRISVAETPIAEISERRLAEFRALTIGFVFQTSTASS